MECSRWQSRVARALEITFAFTSSHCLRQLYEAFACTHFSVPQFAFALNIPVRNWDCGAQCVPGNKFSIDRFALKWHMYLACAWIFAPNAFLLAERKVCLSMLFSTPFWNFLFSLLRVTRATCNNRPICSTYDWNYRFTLCIQNVKQIIAIY